MKVVLFCGGLGTRLGGLDDDAPKPMVKIGYRPMLWYVMKYYAHFGHKDFILCLGYKADLIKKYFLEYDESVSNNFTMTGGGDQIALESRDIDDWRITFVDTGLKANVGQRLKAVEPYLEGEEMFLANYSDGLSNVHLPSMIESLRQTDNVASFMAVKPSQSFHVVSLQGDGGVDSIRPVVETDITINGGYFVFRRELFNYIKEGEELVEEPFRRLIEERKLVGYRHDGFWCMDTFKDHQILTDMYRQGDAPWELWKQPV
jgi:glucose-1-phosphate cytidylyltransferase